MNKYGFVFLAFFVIMSCAGGAEPRENIPDNVIQAEASQDEAIHDEINQDKIIQDETIQEQASSADEIQEEYANTAEFQDDEFQDDTEASDVPELAVIPDAPPEDVFPDDLPEPELAVGNIEEATPQDEEVALITLPEPAVNLDDNARVMNQTDNEAQILPPPSAPPPAVLPPAPPPVVFPAPVTPAPVPQAPEQRAAPPAPPPPAVLPPAAPPAVFPAPVTPAPVPQAPEPPPSVPPPAPPHSAQLQPNTADEEEIIFSRIVRAAVGQLVEIPFRGTGWVYLGELGSQRGISYHSRRLDPEGQSFVFQTEAAGIYALKFYKQDFIRDYILNDYVQIIAGLPSETEGAGWFNPPSVRGRVIAEPRWPASLEEAEIIRGGGRPLTRETTETVTPAVPPSQPAEQPLAAPGTAQSGSPPISEDSVVPAQAPGGTTEQAAALDKSTAPNVFIQKAQEEFEAGKAASAIAILDRFTEYYPAGSDEAYWLYGQFYEANTPSRNILTALDYYRRLIREYPLSSRYNDARRRIAYLERFYINIQ